VQEIQALMEGNRLIDALSAAKMALGGPYSCNATERPLEGTDARHEDFQGICAW
jgi:hypothetical protein